MRRASFREAKEFDSPDALKKYLKEHPDADRSKHTVGKPEARKTAPDEVPGQRRTQPPPIPADARKKAPVPPPVPKKPSTPPPIPEDAKKKPPQTPGEPKPEAKQPEAKQPEAPKEPESHAEHAAKKEPWGQRFKGLSEKASKFVSESNQSVRHFLGDSDFRKHALTQATDALKKSPKKLGANLIETAKHEVQEFKQASAGVKSVLSGGKMTKAQKHAFKSVAHHLALTAAATAFAASGPLASAAIFAKSMATHIAAKSVSKSLGNLHVLQEYSHVGHGIAHIMQHIAAKGKKKKDVDPDEAMSRYILAIVSKEIANLSDEDIQAALEGVEEDDSKEPATKTAASRVVSRFTAQLQSIS